MFLIIQKMKLDWVQLSRLTVFIALVFETMSVHALLRLISII